MKNNIKKPLLISTLLIFILAYGQNDTNEVVGRAFWNKSSR